MLSGKPLFNSVCGQPLWKTVVFLGFLTLGLIFILTGFNAYMVSKGYEDDGAGTKRGVQIVLIILSLVLGVWRSMLLIFGAKPDWPIQGTRSSYLFLWMIITLITFIFRFFLLIWIAINSINGWDPTDTSELEVDVSVSKM